MATTVVVNGSNYSVSSVGEKNWGQNTSDLLIALAVATPGNSGYINYVAVTTTPVTVVSGRTYLVDTSVARTLNLPAPAANAFLHVKDITGGAGSNNITIARNGSEEIDGVAGNKVLALNYGSWFIMSDGTDWWTYNDDNRRVMLENNQTIAGVKTFSSAPVITPTTNQLVLGTTRTVTINAPTPASTSRVVTIPDLSGDYSVVGTIAAQTIAGVKTFSDIPVFSLGATITAGGLTVTAGGITITAGGLLLSADAVTIAKTTNQIILGTTNTVTISSTAPAASRVLTIPDPGAAADFVMSEGTQTINGAKTFGSAIVAPAATFSNTTNQIVLGVTNTVTITSPAPAASRVYTIPDAGGAASFVMTAGNQTIAGTKTFSGIINIADGAVGAPSLAFGSATTTGVYLNGGAFAITVGGTERVRFATTSMTLSLLLRGQDGDSTAPSVSASSDTNTGFYWLGSDQIGVTCGGTNNIQISATNFLPIGSKVVDSGSPATNLWDDIYADDFNNVADIPFFDHVRDLKTGEEKNIDDLSVIRAIKPLKNAKGEIMFNENGHAYWDDSTLPDWIWLRDKYDRTVILRNEDGKPWVSMKVLAGLALGGVKQLEERVTALEKKIAA